MIPKVIHYIWLGGKELPPIAKKCIASWQKYCPDYEIKRWDESNLDLDKYQFVKDALAAKKYAFASDVFRTDIIHKHGGIYFDIDVELVKPIDELLVLDCFMGFESSSLINPGLVLASTPNNEDLGNILKIYEDLTFNEDDLFGQTVCEVFTQYFEKQGLTRENKTQQIGNTTFFSTEYFSPKSLSDGKIRKTKNTYAIHHFNASWLSTSKRIKVEVKQLISRMLGEKLSKKIRTKLREVRNKRNNNSNNLSK